MHKVVIFFIVCFIIATGVFAFRLAFSDPTASLPDIVQVEEKWYEPPFTFITYIPISSGRSFIIMPVVNYDDEDWVVKVSYPHPNYINSDKPVLKYKTLYLTESYWNTIKVGQGLVIRNNDLVKLEDQHKEIEE